MEPLFTEIKIMTLNEITKSENCLLDLHHRNQCLSLSLKNLLKNENELETQPIRLLNTQTQYKLV